MFRYLQSGSYPVMSVDNASFPENMYPYNEDAISVSVTTTFEPKVIATIPVYGPEPGDWYVAAYLSHWDEKVQQQVRQMDYYTLFIILFAVFSILFYNT